MPAKSVWRIEQGVWHVAADRDGRWKVHQEGQATAKSRHPSRDDAVEAARALASARPDARIKIHDPEGRLDEILELG